MSDNPFNIDVAQLSEMQYSIVGTPSNELNLPNLIKYAAQSFEKSPAPQKYFHYKGEDSNLRLKFSRVNAVPSITEFYLQGIAVESTVILNNLKGTIIAEYEGMPLPSSLPAEFAADAYNGMLKRLSMIRPFPFTALSETSRVLIANADRVRVNDLSYPNDDPRNPLLITEATIVKREEDRYFKVMMKNATGIYLPKTVWPIAEGLFAIVKDKYDVKVYKNMRTSDSEVLHG